VISESKILLSDLCATIVGKFVRDRLQTLGTTDSCPSNQQIRRFEQQRKTPYTFSFSATDILRISCNSVADLKVSTRLSLVLRHIDSSGRIHTKCQVCSSRFLSGYCGNRNDDIFVRLNLAESPAEAAIH
jgi:hypothetical protein